MFTFGLRPKLSILPELCLPSPAYPQEVVLILYSKDINLCTFLYVHRSSLISTTTVASYVHCYLWSVPTELPESLSAVSVGSYCPPALTPTEFPIIPRITFQPIAMSSKTPCSPVPGHFSNLFFHSCLAPLLQNSVFLLFNLANSFLSRAFILAAPASEMLSLHLRSCVTSSERTSLPTTCSKMAPFLPFSILLLALLF